MGRLSDTIIPNFVYYYEDCARRVRALADQLSEEQFRTKPYSYGNSFGNLVLHLTGNLSHYIGAPIAGTGYVRDREREFTDRPGSKAAVLDALDTAVAMVVATLREQADSDWPRPYQAEGVDDVHDRFGIYLRCVMHFHHHLGQMIYLVKEFTRPT
jgi:uncharacterized damage-inducible protein DinB